MKIIKEFILREIAGESVLIPTGATSQEFNGMITMSETATFIWEHLETTNSLDEMVEKICEVYEVDLETAHREVVAFISRLFDAGWIACSKEDCTW